MLSNKYNLKIREFLSDVYVFGDDDFNVCEAGFHYNKSDESVLNQSRKKLEKYNMNKLPKYIIRNSEKFKDWLD